MKDEQLSSERENCLHITVATPAYQQSELRQIAHLCISPIIPPKWAFVPSKEINASKALRIYVADSKCSINDSYY